MYEAEIAFLATVENPADKTNTRRPLDPAAANQIRAVFPGIPGDYLGYLQEVGPGTVRECQYMIYEAPMWCHEEPSLSWFDARGRKLLVVGDNFSGDLFALDADQGFRVVELLHEDTEVMPYAGDFKQFIREQMLMGTDGTE